MFRPILISLVLFAVPGTGLPSQDVYPSLTRETLNGVWEGLFGIGTHSTVLHMVITPNNGDSYLSVMDPESLKGTVFRMDSCTVNAGTVKLHFTSFWPLADGGGWWFDGEGFGDKTHAWIEAHFGTDLDKPRTGPRTFTLEKGPWVRTLGEASARAAEDIANVSSGKK